MGLDTPCVLWEGAVNSAGYGHFCITVDGRKRWVYAHRDAYAKACGVVPDGLFVLHRCDVKTCVNPEHLFLGTQFDNMQDHAGKGRHHYGSRHACKNGHEYTPENTKVNDKGWRVCLACVAINNASRREAKL